MLCTVSAELLEGGDNCILYLMSPGNRLPTINTSEHYRGSLEELNGSIEKMCELSINAALYSTIGV